MRVFGEEVRSCIIVKMFLKRLLHMRGSPHLRWAIANGTALRLKQIIMLWNVLVIGKMVTFGEL